MKKVIFLLLFVLSSLNAWNLYPTYPAYLKKRGSLVKAFYFKAKTDKKIVALSFDDGPDRYTPKIMDVLKKYHAPATFFLIAKNIKSNSYKLYLNPLFTAGLHTLSHKNFDKLTKSQIDYDFKKAIKIFNKNNIYPQYFRPAYGVVNAAIVVNLQKYHLKGILWSNDTMDWSKKYRSYKRVIENLSSGDIILMHDHATKPKELEALINAIRAKGFEIVSLSEMMRYRSDYK